MNVLLISQCEKNALTETRRVIDQFAERRGDRVWQTAITKQGLDTLRRMLKKTARKNTAVACHWIRGTNHSELLWIVGASRRFGERGAVPTNSTSSNILRNDDEHDWSSADRVRVLAALAALWHDIGKSSRTFQNKLRASKPTADPLRHEWVSLRLWQAFVGEDDDRGWLTRLAHSPELPASTWLERLQRDEDAHELSSPFKANRMPPLARVIGWLLISHHRLPIQPWNSPSLSQADLSRLPSGIKADWCAARLTEDSLPSLDAEAHHLRIKGCFEFDADLPSSSKAWQKRVRKHASRLLSDSELTDGKWLQRPDSYLLHLARLVLMLADHHYSSIEEPRRRVRGDADCKLIANTLRKTGKPHQRLDEHLIGVEIETGRIVHQLTSLARSLPRIARHKGLEKRTRNKQFAWQNSAYDLAVSSRKSAAERGFFGINMASTGLGKTLANGRIMYALSDPLLGARFSIALGLRTLTLQTGDTYRKRLGLGPDDLAVLVGGGRVRELFEHVQRQEHVESWERYGSESSDLLLDDHCYVHYEGSPAEGPLGEWLARTRGAAQLVNAPVLACTIDHLVLATESLRGGKQIAPMLRLLTSDLVLDEPDDFGLEDLPALARFVHWAGMLGTRVLLSSATLPPSLLHGLFDAYLHGRKHYEANHGGTDEQVAPVVAWFDEYTCQARELGDTDSFAVVHQEWARRRCEDLACAAEQRRRAVIIDVPRNSDADESTVEHDVARQLVISAHDMHEQHHSIDPRTGKRVSFGLVRMANIQPLVEVTRAVKELGTTPGCRLHLVCYHSQHPLLVRSQIERRLDRWLKRDPPEEVFADHDIRAMLDKAGESDHAVIVMATAVAEVGRDHDYDWAVVEPSSMRSIIQLAGRVRRHRPGQVENPNILLLTRNLRALRNKRPAFCRPGFESSDFELETHDLRELLTGEQLARIDAAARVMEREPLEASSNLVDLEHARLRATMLGDGTTRTREAALWWKSPAHLSGELQRQQPFRHDATGRQRFGLELNDDDDVNPSPRFVRYETDGSMTPQGNLMEAVDIGDHGSRNVDFVCGDSYTEQVDALASELGISPADCAHLFGYVELPERGSEQGFFYHPALGFWRRN